MKANLPDHPKQGFHPKKARMGEKKDRDNRKAGSSSGRSQHYTPLNVSLDQVLMQIKNDLSMCWKNTCLYRIQNIHSEKLTDLLHSQLITCTM